MHRWTGALGATFAAAVISASVTVAAQAEDTITFGYVDDLSDVAAESGNDGLHAVELAIAQANANGGVNGKKIELVVYDGKVDPQLTATMATRLVEDDDALVIIGGYPAVPVGAVIPLANEYEIPYLSLAAAPDKFTEPATPYHFRFGPKNSQDAAAIADVVSRQGFKTAAVINNSLPFGIDGGRAVTEALESAGVEVVAQETYEFSATDISPQMVNIRNENPELLVVWPYPADGARVMRTANQMGVNIPTIVARIALYDTFRELSGPTAEGVIIPNALDPEREDVQALAKAYEDMHGYWKPTMFIGMAYDATKMAIWAAGQPEAQSAIEAGDVPAARTAIRDAIEGVGEYEGVEGQPGAAYTFGPDDHQGPPDENWFVWAQIKGDGLVKADLEGFKPGTKRY